jgi:predicted dehydrogenase
MPAPIRIGVIGCGYWGPNHLRVFSQLSGSRVTAFSDLDPKRLTTIGAQYPEAKGYADFHELVASSDVDAVVVCVPTRTHFEVARMALQGGKHVLCEKPLTVDPVESQTLADLAAARQRILMTGHVFLFNPGILKLKELITAGTPGRLFYLRALRTNLGPVRHDVNAVYDLASHDIAIFNFLLNAQPVSASAVGQAFLQPGIEDLAFISLKYPNDVMANIQVSWLDPKKLREIVVVGDKQMVVWDELAPAGPISIYDKGIVKEQYYDTFGQFQLLAREGDITIPRVKPAEPLKVQDQAFLDCINAGKISFSDGAFSVGVANALDAIARSLAAGGAQMTVRQ